MKLTRRRTASYLKLDSFTAMTSLHLRVARFRAFVLIVALSLLGPAAARAHDDLASKVDPFIGTLGAGFTFPGPAAPYGMVQLSPDTEGQFAYTGYQYIDVFIRGFSHVHTESMGVPEGGEVPFMPTTGPVVTEVKQYESLFTHLDEEASPGYYRVGLLSYGIDAELTAGLRVALHRYAFPPTRQANVLIDAGRHIAGGPTDDVQTTPGAIDASLEIVDGRTLRGTATSADYTVHFAARFDRPFTSFGVWRTRGGPAEPNVTTVAGTGAGAYVSFDTTADRVVQVKVGLSFVSRANALENLESELPGEDFDFAGLRRRTRTAWNDALHAIEVSGGTIFDQRSFYTALYHAQHHPNVFHDANGDYLGYDRLTHRIGAPGDPMPAGSTYYANYSMWDTYRAEMPLLMLIAPDRVRDMMRSLAAIAVQGGRLPRWGWMASYADFMNGEPALQVIADAYCRGLVPADALGALYANARTLALDPARHRDPVYLAKGYVPADVDGPGQVGSGASSTLEHAIGDFALALMADRLGETEDRSALLALANSWRNVFDPETRFVRPRNGDGSWVGNPYLPEQPDGFREGTGWQYTWLVPHDVRGLFDVMGAPPKSGDAFVSKRLDLFFATPLTATVPLVMPEIQQKLTLYGIAYYGNQYTPANEHDLQAPWMGNWTAEPWKTQALARAYQGLFRATPDGLPGNDDLGTMSAWFIWSALGFYPVTPGAPIYTVGSPLFEKAKIRLPGGGSFRVEAPEASLVNKYVGSVTLGGAALEKLWFFHDAFADGAELKFSMSPFPNTSAPSVLPPSMSTNPLSDFACQP